ncbi:MAG TPA: IS21 family transposase [Jiangellaceae bacterium]|nr:IS21 family transposase [Jiangellaceae bacterium]
MIDVVEILQHWHAGRPKSVIASSLGVDAKTVRKYVAAAEAAGLAPGGPVLERAAWAGLVAEWFPQLVDAKARSLTFPVIDVHHERIEAMLATNTAATVWQRLRDEHGLTVSVASFRRYVREEIGSTVDESAVTVLRPDVPPGDEAQVDYGFLGSWLDPWADRVRRVWAFVMVLACSRHMFVRPVLRMDQSAWVAAHVAAFAFFGGAPRRVVPDNLKTGVIKPDLYDPKLNRAFAEMAEHCGVLIDPARQGKPKDKPRVERPMSYVRDSFWRGREWVSESEMQTRALEWCLNVAGVRAHRSLDGAAPLAVFNAVEAEALIPLPHEAFELARWSRPKVAPDCHVKVGKALYSVPWRHIGVRVDARQTDRVVELFVAGQLVKTHPRIERGRRTDYGDYPPEKVAFFMRTPTWCRHRAAEIGPHVAELIDGLLGDGLLHHLRAAQGIIGLANKHTHARVDAACARAIAVGDPGYRTVKGILAAGTECDGVVVALAPSAPAHLHGPARLFDGLDGEAVGR